MPDVHWGHWPELEQQRCILLSPSGKKTQGMPTPSALICAPAVSSPGHGDPGTGQRNYRTSRSSSASIFTLPFPNSLIAIMNRLGLLTPSDLDPAQNVLYEALAKSTERLRERYVPPPSSPWMPMTSIHSHPCRFIVRDTKDRFIGPFGIVLHDPTIGDAFLRFAGALAGIKGLPVKAREVAILVVGHRNKAAYEV